MICAVQNEPGLYVLPWGTEEYTLRNGWVHHCRVMRGGASKALWLSSGCILPASSSRGCRPKRATRRPVRNGRFEVKHDGFRFICLRSGKRVRVYLRGGLAMNSCRADAMRWSLMVAICRRNRGTSDARLLQPATVDRSRRNRIQLPQEARHSIGFTTIGGNELSRLIDYVQDHTLDLLTLLGRHRVQESPCCFEGRPAHNPRRGIDHLADQIPAAILAGRQIIDEFGRLECAGCLNPDLAAGVLLVTVFGFHLLMLTP
jgi:hypothetical protein